MKHRAFRAGVRPTKAKPLIPLNRHLAFETLEARRLLANVTVSNFGDVVNGNVMSIAKLINNDGRDGISLREAIAAANNTAGADMIDFAASLSGGAIELLGVLSISGALTIDASALSGGLTIDAGDGIDHFPSSGDGFSIFNIDDGDSDNQILVQLSGLTLTGGDRSYYGGAIYNRENLTITGSSIVGNSAGSKGGGIFNEGTATLINSSVSNNPAGFAGGGIFNNGTVILLNSTLSGNLTLTYGGGIFNNYAGTATFIGSTLTNNYSYYGGAISNQYGGTVIITNSTISGNSAGWHGGGMETQGTATVTGSTITGNSATYSGGIVNGNQLTLSGSIIAGNMAFGGFPDVGSGATGGAYNLIGDGAGMGGLVNGVDGNQVGSGGSPIDPHLGPLQDNGGPTLTHALLPGSPAINAGDPGYMPPPDFDQRGAPFARISGGRIDIGAFEVQTAVAPSADFDNDGFITGLDFLLWQIGVGTPAPDAVKTDGDADNDTDVDGDDLDIWELQYGGPAPLVAAASAPISAASLSAPSPAGNDLVDLALAVHLAKEPIGAVDDAEVVTVQQSFVDDRTEAPLSRDGPTGSAPSSESSPSATQDPIEQTVEKLRGWEDAIDEALAAVFA